MATQPLPKPKLGFAFDGKNERAQRAAADGAARLVTRVSEATRQGIRAAVVRSIRDGVPPVKLARELRGMVGLTAPQAGALAGYVDQLYKMGLSVGKVEALARKYEARMIRHRAITIARTETMGALNKGALEGYLQAQDKGRLPANAIKKWKAAPSELRPPRCPICSQLDGNEVPLQGTFSNGSEAPPAHPRCRCTLVAKAPMPAGKALGNLAPPPKPAPPKPAPAASLKPTPPPPPAKPVGMAGFDLQGYIKDAQATLAALPQGSLAGQGELNKIGTRMVLDMAQRMGLTEVTATTKFQPVTGRQVLGGVVWDDTTGSARARAWFDPWTKKVHFGPEASQDMRSLLEKGTKKVGQDRAFKGIQTSLHELNHAHSGVDWDQYARSKWSYGNGNGWLEEGITEHQARAMAAKVLGQTATDADRYAWAYHQPVKTVRAVAAWSGRTVEEIQAMDHVARWDVAVKAGTRRLEDLMGFAGVPLKDQRRILAQLAETDVVYALANALDRAAFSAGMPWQQMEQYVMTFKGTGAKGLAL